MAIRMNLWTLTLLPNEPVPMYVRRDFQITNAALGEELRSKDGRSVVKVTHTPAMPGGMDSDDEYDSDDDMPDFDEDSDDSETDDEAMPIGAELESSEDDDEEGDMEDSDEDDDEDSDDEDFYQETAVVCSLTAGKTEQTTLDLTFVQGDVIIFEVTGENAVHLIGNYINQWPIEAESDDEERDDYDDLDLSEEDEEDEFSLEELSEDEIEAPAGKIMMIEEPKVAKADKKRKAQESDEEEEEEEKPAVEQLSKSQRKKLAKKAKLEAAAAAAPAAPAPTPAPKKEEPKESKKKTLPSGLIIEDVKIGTGAVAKPGKKLGMRYVGKLTNGKQFDANTAGAPFRFVLGRGEVIKGWDQGLAGMAIGGERRLTVPPKLAYDKQKLPGIPPNSTLVFDVKLVSIN